MNGDKSGDVENFSYSNLGTVRMNVTNYWISVFGGVIRGGIVVGQRVGLKAVVNQLLYNCANKTNN